MFVRHPINLGFADHIWAKPRDRSSTQRVPFRCQIIADGIQDMSRDGPSSVDTKELCQSYRDSNDNQAPASPTPPDP